MSEINWSPAAIKQMKQLPLAVRKRIYNKVEKKLLGSSGTKKLAGEEDLWRIRVGDYRVVFVPEGEDSFLVVRVGHRREVYRD